MGFPILGVFSLLVLLWGLLFRLDRWAAWQFVLPVWIAAVSAVAGSVSAWKARARRMEVPLRPLRALVWVLVAVVLLWAWFPPTERLVGWWIRQVTMFRFG